MDPLILGLGNELLGDEGVGVHAARKLQEKTLPEAFTVVEVGTAILDALPYIEEANRIIVIDAMKADRPPGTVYEISLDDCNGASHIASMHGFDIHRVMALAGRRQPPPVKVYGIEPEFIGWSMGLSPPVEEGLDMVLQELYKAEIR